MNKSVIEKIKKLLALATSPNENEAKSAASKASKLLIQYNLDQQEIEAHHDYQKEVAFDEARKKCEQTYIFPILQQFFFVEVINSRNFGSTKIYFIGTETNVQVAKYIHDFLIIKFKDLFKEYKNNSENRVSRKSYYYGLMQGLRSQLENTQKDVEAERGLVLVKDPELERAVKKEFPNIRHTSRRLNIQDRKSMSAGIEHGQNIKLSKGLKGDGYNSGKFITNS